MYMESINWGPQTQVCGMYLGLGILTGRNLSVYRYWSPSATWKLPSGYKRMIVPQHTYTHIHRHTNSLGGIYTIKKIIIKIKIASYFDRDVANIQCKDKPENKAPVCLQNRLCLPPMPTREISKWAILKCSKQETQKCHALFLRMGASEDKFTPKGLHMKCHASITY